MPQVLEYVTRVEKCQVGFLIRLFTVSFFLLRSSGPVGTAIFGFTSTEGSGVGVSGSGSEGKEAAIVVPPKASPAN